MTTTSVVAAAVERAQRAAGLSQRALQDRTGIPQATLSRIIAGRRSAKLPELVRIAEATGHTLAQLTDSSIAARVECAARSTNGASMEEMRARLLHFIELDAYLDDHAVPVPL